MTTTTRQDRRTDADVVYPETDGKPIAENTRQFRWIVTIKEGIEAEFANDPMVFVAGDLFWYPVKGEPDLRTAPDVLGDRRSTRRDRRTPRRDRRSPRRTARGQTARAWGRAGLNGLSRTVDISNAVRTRPRQGRSLQWAA